MQLSGASFILRMKSRVLLRSKVGIIMVSICLHGVISWSQASGRGRFGPTKTVITEKYHPSVFKFCLTWTVYYISNKMTKFYDDVYSFEPVGGCQFLKLYISMFEKRLESPQWLLAVSKPKVRMRVTSAWGLARNIWLNYEGRRPEFSQNGGYAAGFAERLKAIACHITADFVMLACCRLNF